MKKQLFYLILFSILLFTKISLAVDIAPRISDREIIQSLAEIKAEIKSSQKVSEQRFESIDKRFDQQREYIDQRFNDMANSMNHIWAIMVVTLAGIFGLIGFIVWDRKTALRPLEKRMETFEKDVQKDLELRHENGSLLTRLVKSLQELAKQDEKVAVILRNYSLL